MNWLCRDLCFSVWMDENSIGHRESCFGTHSVESSLKQIYWYPPFRKMHQPISVPVQKTCKWMIYSICLLSLNSIPKLTPVRGGSCWRVWGLSISWSTIDKFRPNCAFLTEPPLTLMWNFRKGASPLLVLKSFQNLNSATFETMNTEKLDLKPQH